MLVKYFGHFGKITRFVVFMLTSPFCTPTMVNIHPNHLPYHFPTMDYQQETQGYPPQDPTKKLPIPHGFLGFQLLLGCISGPIAISLGKPG
jgi:hypothetical protein